MNNIETLRHRIRVHIANREHYSKVEFLDKLHEILHESEQTGAQPAPVQETAGWKWHQAPVKTSWGHEMVVADLAIDKDNTVSVYCERDQTTKVEAMFNQPAQPAPVPASWMEMVTANLVREGVNKHKARELAEHFYGLAPAAQHQCKWPTCQSEEYQQALAEQINQELVTGAAQPAPVQGPVALHAMAKRRIFDAIRGAYDLGYNDARGARAVHGDSAPGYKGRDVEADHGGALFSALERYTAPPAAQRQFVGLTDDEMYLNCPNWLSQEQCKTWVQQIEAKLRSKNNG